MSLFRRTIAVGPLTGSGQTKIVTKIIKKYHTLSGSWDEFVEDPETGLPVYVRTVFLWRYHNPNTFHRVDYVTSKWLRDDAAVDSRKGFATGNFEGAKLYDDPNAEPGSFNFGDYAWKGGLFAGNMPPAGDDKSGTGRIQLKGNVTINIPATKLATLVLYYYGAPGAATEAVSLSAFQAGSQQPNLDFDPMNLTWANAWDRSLMTQISTVAFNAVVGGVDNQAGEYINWNVGLSPNFLCVAMQSEADLTVKGWRYFASKEYEAEQTALGKAFPLTDCRPRVWTLDEGARTSW